MGSRQTKGERTIVRLLRKEGLRDAHVDRCSGGHIKITLPNGRKVFTSMTPSDRRVLENLRHQLRRANKEK